MKNIFLFAAALSVTTLYLGAFQIPKGSHDISQIDEAAKKAAKSKQPISFVITKKTLTPT